MKVVLADISHIAEEEKTLNQQLGLSNERAEELHTLLHEQVEKSHKENLSFGETMQILAAMTEDLNEVLYMQFQLGYHIGINQNPFAGMMIGSDDEEQSEEQ